jgi:hypothetical protein
VKLGIVWRDWWGYGAQTIVLGKYHSVSEHRTVPTDNAAHGPGPRAVLPLSLDVQLCQNDRGSRCRSRGLAVAITGPRVRVVVRAPMSATLTLPPTPPT